MSTRLPTLLQRSTVSETPTSPLQSQVDSLVGGFVAQATDLKTLAAISTGSLAFRASRVGLMGMGSGTLARSASTAFALGSEVTAFELTHRGITSLSERVLGPAQRHENPNLWRWAGNGGLRQGLTSSFVTFGALKGAGHVARAENVVVRHLLQDTAMVMGHQVSGALEFAPRPTGSLAEQFLHAEAINLQLGAGMFLVHRLAPGLHGMERGLHLALSVPTTPDSRHPSGQPIEYIDEGQPIEYREGQPIEYIDGHTPPFAFSYAAQGPSGSRRPARSPVSVEETLQESSILMSVRKDEAGLHEGGMGESGIHLRQKAARTFSVRTTSALQESTPPPSSEEAALPPPALPALYPGDASGSKPPSSRSSSFPIRQALQASEARMETILKALPDPLLVIDREGTILQVHAERDELLMLPSEQLLGKRVLDLPFSTELKEWGMGVIERALDSGETQREEFTIPWRDGSIHHQEARVVANGPNEVFCIVRDITDLKRAEASHLAAERLAALQRFSKEVAHDLGNLLVGLQNYAGFGARNLNKLRQLADLASGENFTEDPQALRRFQDQLTTYHRVLARGSQAPEQAASETFRFMALQAAEVLERMARDQSTVLRHTERLGSLIADLKELGEKSPEGPPFDPNDLFEEGQIRAILDRSENLEGFPEKLVLDLTQDPWRVPGPQGNIARVVENLIVNARDAMEGRSERRLTLRTRKAHLDEAALSHFVFPPLGPNVKPGPFMSLRVEDTGEGMNEETLHQIFEPFFTTKKRSETSNSGSGLGLAIALSMVQNAGGFIAVESQPERGTAFEIYLPAVDSYPRSEVSHVEALSPSLHERVRNTPLLIVDDEPAVLHSSRRVLEHPEFGGFKTVLVAQNPFDALASLEKNPGIGLALIDINLTEMNGVELLRQMKARNADLLCVLCTGNDHAGHARGILPGPSLILLDKPFPPPDQFALLIQNMIGNSLRR